MCALALPRLLHTHAQGFLNPIYQCCSAVIASSAAPKTLMAASQLLLSISRTVRAKYIIAVPAYVIARTTCVKRCSAAELAANVETMTAALPLDMQCTVLTSVSETHCLPWRGVSEQHQACAMSNDFVRHVPGVE